MRTSILAVIICVLLGTALQAQIDLTSDIIAYYPFNGNANNSIGSAADGLVYDAILTTDRFGNENQAYSFSGSNYIEIADGDIDFNIKTNGYTVSLWVYPEADQLASTNVILGLGLDGSNGWEFSYLSNPRFMIKLLGGDVYGSTRSYVYVDSDQWYHYVFVYTEDGYVQMYANGKQFLKEYCPNYNPVTGSNFVIGTNTNHSSGFTGKIDELKIYDRALSFLEVATLTENESSVDAARKGTVFHADFENKILDAEQLGADLDAENGGSITVVENPEKDAVNSSDYVAMPKTPKSTSGNHTRAELSSKWTNQFETFEKTHIFQWMVYFPEDYLKDIDIDGTWQIITQFVTHPCARYEDGFEDVICGSGGIFNELRINRYDYDTYGFEYRAEPDCNEVAYTFPRGEWIKFIYQIFWTTDDDGWYKVWANEELLGEANNVQTLPEGWIEGDCDLRWKVGLYDSWASNEVDSVYYYFDNLETYIDKDIMDVCPQCATDITATNGLIFNNDINIKLFPNPSTGQIGISGLDQPANIVVYNLNGGIVKQLFAKNNFTIADLSKGVYLVEIHTDCEILVRRIVKL
jgi:hypothetical protein